MLVPALSLYRCTQQINFQFDWCSLNWCLAVILLVDYFQLTMSRINEGRDWKNLLLKLGDVWANIVKKVAIIFFSFWTDLGLF